MTKNSQVLGEHGDIDVINADKGISIKATATQAWSAAVVIVIATVFLWTMKMDQSSMRDDINKIQEQISKMNDMVIEVYYQRRSSASSSIVPHITNP